MQKTRILTVCTGNICRSPMAEGILRAFFLNKPDIEVLSAGTHAVAGNPPSDFSVITAGEYGMDISFHRAREVDSGMIQESQVILCMEQLHVEFLISLDISALKKAHNLADFSSIGKRLKNISDPYGCSLREYRECFSDITMCIRNFLASDQFRSLKIR